MADYTSSPADSLVSYTQSSDRNIGFSYDTVVDVGLGGGAIQVFQMRAYHTVLTRYVVWDSLTTPDFTGSGSGYTPGDLYGVVVTKIGYQIS